MNKKYINFLPLIIIIIVLSFLGIKIIENLKKINPENEIKSVLIGRNVPQIKIPSLNENTNEFIIDGNTKGPYLINFFSSWCIPCQYEAPLIENLSKIIDVYGIAYKDTYFETTKFLKSFGNPYIKIGVDIDGLVSINLGVYGVPETFLVSSKNKIILRHAGALTNEVLRKKIYPELRKLGL